MLRSSAPRHPRTHGLTLDDEYRSTPLGVAARRGQEAMVRLLLDRGADPDAAGAPWATPLAWALRRGHGEIADMAVLNAGTESR